MSKTVIYTINEKEYNEAMKILYKLDYTWCDGDPCNTEWKPDGGVDRLIYLSLYDDKTITFNTEKPKGRDIISIISLEEFIMQPPLPFTKADLEDGMIMKTRDGRYYMYLKKYNRGLRHEGFISLDDYDDDLTCYRYISNYDIVAVYNPKDLTTLDFVSWVMYHDPIWKRPEKVRMTIKEIEEKLGIKNLEIIEEEEEFDE